MSFWASITNSIFCQSKLIHTIPYNPILYTFFIPNSSTFYSTFNAVWPISTLEVNSSVCSSSQKSRDTTELNQTTKSLKWDTNNTFPSTYSLGPRHALAFFPLRDLCSQGLVISNFNNGFLIFIRMYKSFSL